MLETPQTLPPMSAQGPRLRHDVDLTRRNTFGLPARARLLARVDNEEALAALMRWRAQAELPYVVLGGGSNLVFSREFYDALFVVLKGDFARIENRQGGVLRVGAGVGIGRLLRHCLENQRGGLECLFGIPGAVGGAVVGNAGWGGRAIGDRVRSLRLMDGRGDLCEMEREALRFEYRRTHLGAPSLQGPPIVLFADLTTERASPDDMRNRLAEARGVRSRQPKGRSAGCVFRNPVDANGVVCDSAGRLIDAAGLKGTRLGGALVSPEHANFIVNAGDATGRDVVKLVELVRRTVLDRFGVRLDTEVRIL